MSASNGGGGSKRSGGAKDTTSRPLPKRFYAAAAALAHEAGFAVALDGRIARTPGKRPLAVASRALAEALAAEWAAQRDVVDPAAMPLTRIVNSALDGVAAHHGEVAADIVKYAGSDLVCYRAEGPQGLRDRQAQAWDPVLAWARETLGAHLVPAEGIMPVGQSGAALARIAARLERLDALQLAGLHALTTLLGSALLALSVLEGQLSVEEAWSAAHVDEDWQIEQWGADPEAEQRRARRWEECAAAARLIALAR